MIDILLPAFLLIIVLLGIHSFFGVEIIRRGIIFTDLAVGQMAAVGAAVSLYFFDGEFLYPIAVLFAVITGLIISFASKFDKEIEAFIGLIYAFGISTVFIIFSKYPHGMEDFQNLMATDILFTSLDTVLKVAILYIFVAIALYFLKDKDMAFFVLFSLTVASSVKVAGVLIVFSILIAPAYIAIKLFNKHLFVYAWIIGFFINAFAVYISYQFDFPTGYTVVFFNAFSGILVAIYKIIKGFQL